MNYVHLQQQKLCKRIAESYFGVPENCPSVKQQNSCILNEAPLLRLKRLQLFPEYYLKLITTTCNTLFCGMLQQCGMENIFSSLPQPNKKNIVMVSVIVLGVPSQSHCLLDGAVFQWSSWRWLWQYGLMSMTMPMMKMMMMPATNQQRPALANNIRIVLLAWGAFKRLFGFCHQQA